MGRDKGKIKGQKGKSALSKEKFNGEQQMQDAKEEAARRGIEIW